MSENLRRAVSFVEQAAQRGAQIVLLPELMSDGYCLTEALWDSAEPLEGSIVSWLKALAQRLGLYLGTTFLEVDGEDFYNTLALAASSARLTRPHRLVALTSPWLAVPWIKSGWPKTRSATVSWVNGSSYYSTRL